MFNLSELLIGKHYIGVENFSSAAQDFSSYVLVCKKKDEIAILDQITLPIGNFPEKWNKKLPVYLVVNTAQVIQKEVMGNEVSNDKIVYKAFPNIQLEDFYYEIWKLESKSIIALTRKAYVHEIVNDFLEKKIEITGITLGVCSLENIAKYLDKDDVSTTSHLINARQNSLTLSPNQSDDVKEYLINGLQIISTSILAFSGIIHLLLREAEIGNILPYNLLLKNQYFQKAFFSKGSKIILGVLLTTLFVNFLIFNYYFKKDLEATNSFAINKSILDEFNYLNKKIDIKNKKLKSVSSRISSRSSYLINEIVKIMPTSITLVELTYLPLDKKVKPNELITVQDKIIIISGETVNNDDFTSWLEKIEKLNWVKDIIIVSYGKEDSIGSSFSIKIIHNWDDSK